MDNNNKNGIYSNIKMSKRAADIIVASIALILLSFIMVAIFISL